MFKIYTTGQEFLDENINIIRNDPLGTTFFEKNAQAIAHCNTNDYAIRIETNGQLLLAIHVGDYPIVLYGSEHCADELADVIANNQLIFNKTIGPYELSNAFLTAYEQRVGGSHEVHLFMDVMYCDKVNPCDTSSVQRAVAKDVADIAHIVVDFTYEALGEKPEFSQVYEDVSERINSYALLRLDGAIVSVASGYDEDNGLCRLANVYTLPEHRNKGYSRKVVTYLTEQAILGGKIPYLHVDQHNPVSNHLYSSIGYVYGKSRYEIIYVPVCIED
ncbi:MAG: GNAT family N-acetyltransferase [Clostridiales bacterium]|nr:GNAT family N-acetyltransferase [Clostridiales bacterium]